MLVTFLKHACIYIAGKIIYDLGKLGGRMAVNEMLDDCNEQLKRELVRLQRDKPTTEDKPPVQ